MQCSISCMYQGAITLLPCGGQSNPLKRYVGVFDRWMYEDLGGGALMHVLDMYTRDKCGCTRESIAFSPAFPERKDYQ